MDLRGKFIVLDGPDGSGKGTQIQRLAAWIDTQGCVSVTTRDPGGTAIGDRIRHILLGYDLSVMDPRCEALLFMASRAQLMAEVVRPALAAGHAVLCDRFISATCAYQGAAGVPADDVIRLGRLAIGNDWPHLTIVLDLPPELGFERTGRKSSHTGRSGDAGQLNMFDGATSDAMERRPLDFHRQVRANFLDLPRIYPAPVEIVSAEPDAGTVWSCVQEVMRRAFP